MILPPHGGQLRRIAEAHGLRPEEILDFSANINPEGPSAGVLSRLRAALEDPATLTLYPDLELHALRMALAGHLSVPPERLAIANGFGPLLASAVRSMRLRRCLLPIPCFGEYRRALASGGAQAIPYEGKRHNFRYDAGALLRTAHEAGADAILLANPQNPTGLLTGADEMRSLGAAARQQGLTVLLDEAFIDYAPQQSLCHSAEETGLVVFRSLTKFYAMPGLRVAYCVAHPVHVEALNQDLPAWPVSTLAALAAEAALEDDGYEARTLELNQRRREAMRTALSQLGLETLPGAANFLLLRFGRSAEGVHTRLLMEHRILARSCANFDGLTGEFLRVAVRNDHDNERLMEALRNIVGADLTPTLTQTALDSKLKTSQAQD